MSDSFDVTIEQTDIEHVVRVRGDVDLESSPKLWERLQASLKQSPRVAVNLADVSYIDSSGVATLIQGLKHAAKAKAAYRLQDPSPRVMAVLELAQLPQLFEIERRDPTG